MCKFIESVMAGVFMLLTVPIVNWRTSDHVSNVLAFRVFTRHQYMLRSLYATY